MAAGLMVGVAACGDGGEQGGGEQGGSEQSSADRSEAVAQSSSEATTSTSALSGSWVGTWTSGVERLDARLGVITDQPFLATIDIPGRCGATWNQKSRKGHTVVVAATVTYGACTDNEWTLTLSDSSIVGVDPTDSTTRVRFTRD